MRQRVWYLVWVVVLFSALGGVQACGGDEKTCQLDKDCPLKGEVCRAEKCVQQKLCEDSVDCQYKGETCELGRCEQDQSQIVTDSGSGDGGTKPRPATCPKSPETCSSDDDCKPCPSNRRSCINGYCASSKRGEFYDRCGEDVGVACGDKMVCSGNDKARYCLPECDPKQKRCNNNKGGCFDPRRLGVGLCIPDGQAKEGDTCSKSFVGESKLDESKLCKEGLYCSANSTCKKPVTVGKYDKCQSGRLCADTATCVVLSQTATSGYCLPKCDPNKTDCEGGQGRCVKLPSGGGGCLPKGTGKEDARCGPRGDKLLPGMLCAAGMQCVGLSQAGALCLKAVSACGEKACAEGRECLSGQGNGVCAKGCTQNQQNACPSGQSCQPFPVQGGQKIICVPAGQ